jgi:NAD(P)-dependent dehydrogenase (short-subunit alcohol dehydrogenase family)
MSANIALCEIPKCRKKNLMKTLSKKNVVVIGGSRGLGRVIVNAVHTDGAQVLAVARQSKPLSQLPEELPGVITLAADATDESAPARVFETLRPDVLVICAGAVPHMASLQDQDWQEFARNWNTDVKASFLFCKAALRLPLSPGATIILISSGAAIGGSPLSGSYAGAKRTQMFIAKYSQKESDRLSLGLRFLALAPAGIMVRTGVGDVAVDGYAKYFGVSVSEFLKDIESNQTPQDVAKAVMEFATQPNSKEGTAFTVTGKGVELVS